jgi:hypothetical protein
MKFILIATSVLAAVTPTRTSSVSPLGNEPPMRSCGVSSDILSLEKVSLNPFPIQKGEKVTVFAQGVLSEQLVKGTRAELTVKVGMVPLLKVDIDVCEQAKNVGLFCPLNKGPQTIQFSQDIPKFLPSASANIEVRVFTPDNRRIACVQGKVQFE